MASYTRDQYTQQILQMLPPGKAFTRDPDSNLYRMMYSLSGQIKQVDDTALDLAIDWQPGNTTNFLPEWQESLGLPDQCVTTSSPFEDQRNQVVARLTFSGSATAKFIQSYAESLGYEVEVKEWGQMICDVQACGTNACGPEDRSVEACMTINVTNDKDPALLLCEIRQFIPPYLSFYFFDKGVSILN
ncbi:DUF2313 domain-containing protein [Acetobacter persici]|uniref:putative phage tail protein n=1 Tax=Acetobacter persici TaxID=1076596 RepID=UPI001BA45175|nr:putative phage tail protein [Acetobacter persici]MBS1017251.1 DUF2313 domain-containing protein [Acetobacter persici]MCP9321048.1 DUF2313 domain-containing protein [Acetobacter persici]